MAQEVFPENSYLENLSGLTDSITGVYYPAKGEGLDWYVSFVKCIYRLVRNVSVCSGLRVYKISDLGFAIKDGMFFDGNTFREYDDTVEYSLTDNATNYIYIKADGSVVVNTTGFPSPESERHIRLATIITSNGNYTDDDITDYRGSSVWSVIGPVANIADGAVDSETLADSVADAIPQVSVSVGTENSDTIPVTVQVQDIQGNNLSGRFLIRVWLSDTQYGGECSTAPNGGTSWSVGTVLETQTADKRWLVITDGTGKATIDITDTGTPTFYLNVELDGRIYVSNPITFA